MDDEAKPQPASVECAASEKLAGVEQVAACASRDQRRKPARGQFMLVEEDHA